MTEPLDLDALRGTLAEIEHQRWADWQRWMHSVCIRNKNGTLTVPAKLRERWERQIVTPYADMTEREQACDMEQVDRYWPHIQALVDRLAAAEGTRVLAVGLAEIAEARIAALEAAARRVTIAWPYFQELTDYVEFESAMHDLTVLVEETS